MRVAAIVLVSIYFALSQVSGQSMAQILQEQFILAEDGDTLVLPEGVIEMNRTLSLDGKTGIVIQGGGSSLTTLSFADQVDGGEGLRITNCKDIEVRGISVLDSKGDAVKAQYVTNIYFEDVVAGWPGKPNKNNGAYGLYPVQCTNVELNNCRAFGASDAGIYVGQTETAVVHDCIAERNVAGIEIENTTNADVYNNVARDNTGGILVFDLPDLEKKRGGNVRVFENEVSNNNLKNFAPKGNIVAQVPPGTGIMIMATSDVEVFGNAIHNNQTVNTAVMSYYITELEISDTEYDPYPSRVYIHDNSFERKRKWPILKNKFGWLFLTKFGKKVPNIIYDGIPPDDALDVSGILKEQYEICIHGNSGETFANLDAANKFKSLSEDITPFQCK